MATDYEKKYNEALERAKKMMDSKRKVVVEKQALETIFPELAESEDERIRKWLVDYFSSIDKAWIHKDITCIDILRWLEKQKEKKKEKFPPYVTGFKGHPDPAGTSDLEEAAKEYASKTLCDPDDGPSTGLAKESFIAGAKWQKEQKSVDNPKWNELTWKDINELERIINNVHYEFQNGIGEDSFGELVLERFREYKDDGSMDEQKPAEWSEEDEKDMAHIIRILDDCYVYGTHDLSKTDHENLVNKLKSLRPSWKPNEEQMDALHRCVDYLHGEGSGYFDPINSLYEQLKKL